MKIPIFTADVEIVQTSLDNIIAERLENETEEKERTRIAQEKAKAKAAGKAGEKKQTIFTNLNLRVQVQRFIQPLANVNIVPGIQSNLHFTKDQLKKKVSSVARNHFIDVWYDWLTSEELVEKMDSYDNLRISKVHREISHINTKCYPRKPEYQRGDKKQNYSRGSKGEYETGPTFHCDRIYKRSIARNDRKPALSGVPSKKHLPVHVPHYRTSPVLKHFDMTRTSPLRPLRKCGRPPRKLYSLCSNDLCWFCPETYQAEPEREDVTVVPPTQSCFLLRTERAPVAGDLFGHLDDLSCANEV
ncbi:hypothetical protein CDAR_568261 [Caerostris darwini]|uniref:Uncharacterized protein n=1 Tax=Caerostris darwini TaxID=1538125 RepID=A0AAV4QTK6_9ARAC|nr:hypothetical protein CDAR_568261 [Caerostris darwini]